MASNSIQQQFGTAASITTVQLNLQASAPSLVQLRVAEARTHHLTDHLRTYCIARRREITLSFEQHHVHVRTNTQRARISLIEGKGTSHRHTVMDVSLQGLRVADLLLLSN